MGNASDPAMNRPYGITIGNCWHVFPLAIFYFLVVMQDTTITLLIFKVNLNFLRLYIHANDD